MIFLTFLGLSPSGILFILIELGIVAEVVRRQIKSANETQERIFELSNLMPTEAQVRLKIAYIPNSILTQTASRELIKNLNRYLRWQPSFSDDDPIKEIDIIEPQKEHSENFGRIRNALPGREGLGKTY